MYQLLALGFFSTTIALLCFILFTNNSSPLPVNVAATDEKKPSREHMARIMSDYLALWAGKTHLAEQVLSPHVLLNVDRHPTSTGSEAIVVNNSKEFMEFLKSARHGWDEYAFRVIHWAADGHSIAIRWKLEAVMGSNYPTPTSLKQGDKCTFSGVDFLVLNKTTGLIDEINSASDMLNLLYAMGVQSLVL